MNENFFKAERDDERYTRSRLPRDIFAIDLPRSYDS